MGNLPGGHPPMKLDEIKAALLASYETDGGINHLDGVNLPSQESVNAIARDCMHLLFPGYFEESRLVEEGRARPRRYAARRGSAKGLEVEIEQEPALLQGPGSGQARPRPRRSRALGKLPDLRKAIRTDVEAAYRGDPAARSYEEIILAYPCVLGISLQRFAHVLYQLGVPLLPRMITEFAHERTGMDIHPGRRIGTHFFIDHGTGVVIGETATIGDAREALPGRDARGQVVRDRQPGQPRQGREAPSRHRRQRDDLRACDDPRGRHAHRRELRRRRKRLAPRLGARRTASPTSRRTTSSSGPARRRRTLVGYVEDWVI